MFAVKHFIMINVDVLVGIMRWSMDSSICGWLSEPVAMLKD
jgi:hypothetical protein